MADILEAKHVGRGVIAGAPGACVTSNAGVGVNEGGPVNRVGVRR